MEVYLVRHGEAKPEHEDLEKSLSDNGRYPRFNCKEV